MIIEHSFQNHEQQLWQAVEIVLL